VKKSRSRPRTGRDRQQSAGETDSASRLRAAASGLLADQTNPIQVLIDLLKQNNLAELEVEREGIRIRLKRETTLPPAASMRADSVTPLQEPAVENLDVSVSADTAGKVTITSPIVGTFYRSPSPDADPYVEEGDMVKKGQVLCIVEAMKLMNEIESEVDGRIVKILAESTKPVEYGQPLFLIDPAPAL
jgi:acetyl-CoA carboxylase biotin carboxyl carrier protein